MIQAEHGFKKASCHLMAMAKFSTATRFILASFLKFLSLWDHLPAVQYIRLQSLILFSWLIKPAKCSSQDRKSLKRLRVKKSPLRILEDREYILQLAETLISVAIQNRKYWKWYAN